MEIDPKMNQALKELRKKLSHAVDTYHEKKEKEQPMVTGISTASTDVKQVEATYTPPVEVVRSGKQLILPEGMAIADGIKALKRRMKEDDEVIMVHEEFDCHPLEGVVAMMDALREIYGWATPVPTPGFFGPKPPERLSVEVAPGVFREAFWGSFSLAGVDGRLETGFNYTPMQFLMVGSVKRRYSDQVGAVASAIRRHLASLSIYRGQAIIYRVDPDRDDRPSIMYPPKFMPVPAEPVLIFNEGVEQQIEANIFTPIARASDCRLHNIPLKRGVLLEGPFGTGKTLTAYATAAVAVKHQWTFIYVEKVKLLKDVLEFAKHYQPAVIFAEDLDSILGDKRTEKVNEILNTIDGISSKDTEIMVILTTNNVEDITPAMIRPGRLDAVISVQAPDAPTAERLLRYYGNGVIADGPLPQASHALAGAIPAVIREAVERAKLYAIGRVGDGEAIEVCDEDIAAAAKLMQAQVTLLHRPVAAPALTIDGMIRQQIAEEFKEAADRYGWD